MKNYRLQSICIKENWFTGGSTEQYQRMFQLNDNGKVRLSDDEILLHSVALIIWLCSYDKNDEEVPLDKIKEKLLKTEAETAE